MLVGLLLILILIIILGPNLWVKHVLKKYHQPIEEMPGTGGELAQHLAERFELTDLTIKEGLKGDDHYNPQENSVSLSPEAFRGKSLSAVAIAAHEMGHALQFNRNEPVSKLRDKYLSRAFHIKRLGIFILLTIPLITVIFKVPHISLITAVIGVLTMMSSVLMYVAILPEEYDASFNKALPILESGYIPENHIPAVRKILLACALTYVAAAFADILRLWRWIKFLR